MAPSGNQATSKKPDKQLRVIITDDHEVFRLGMKVVIESDPGFTVVGEASHGEELLELLSETPCDLVILDLTMPVMDGFTLLEELSDRFPGIKKVVLSMRADKSAIKRALACQIDGYLIKKDISEVTLFALRQIQMGKKYFSDEVQSIILDHYDDIFDLNSNASSLTKREKEVSRLIAAAKTNKDIAKQLNISVHTVQFHRANAMAKLNMKNTADLVKFVLDNDI